MVVPGETYQFDVPVSAQTADHAALGVWRDWDQFEVTSVLWGDGLTEGDEELKVGGNRPRIIRACAASSRIDAAARFALNACRAPDSARLKN